VDAKLERLWLDADPVSEASGVPAPLLVEVYLRLLEQYGTGEVPAEAIAHAGQQVVALAGTACEESNR
jgi:hypothetical protein